MGRIILVLCLLIGFAAQAQYPPGYTGINQRYDWFLGKFRGLHVPGKGADDTTFLTSQWRGAGAVVVDTVNNKFYFWSGGRWWEAGGSAAFTPAITPPTITSNQNNYNPTGLATAAVLRISSNAARSITGIDASAFEDGKVLILHNIGSQDITLVNFSSSSSTGNKFLLLDNLIMRADQTIVLRYDGVDGVWRVFANSIAISAGYGTIASTGIFPITSAGTLRVDTGTLKNVYWPKVVPGWDGGVTGSLGIGLNVLAATTTQDNNTAIGHDVLKVATAAYNTGVGNNALVRNTTGDQNVAVGALSAQFNTTGTKITAIGTAALENNTTGSFNTGVGHDVMIQNTTGSENVGIGWLGWSQNRTGSYNVGVGNSSGRSVVHGNYNVAVGANSMYIGVGGTQEDTVRYSIALGYGTTTTKSYQMVLGNDSLTETRIYGITEATGPKALYYDPATQILTYDDATGGGGSGTVTEVTATDANGFNFTVTDGTTTPNITLETTVSNDQLVVANAGDIIGYGSLTFIDADDVATLTVGESGGSRGQIVFQNATNSYTLSAPGSGTNVLELPTNAGTEGQVLTKGSANTSSWQDAGGISMGYSLFADTLKSGSTVLSITNRAQINEEFNSALSSTGGSSSFYDGSAGTGADAAPINKTLVGNQGGVAQLTTGTTNTGAGYLASSTFMPIDTNNYYRWGAYNVRLEDLSDGTETFMVRMGFLLGETVQNEIYFKYTHSLNSGNWTVYSENASTAENTNTAVAVVADTDYDLEFEFYEGTVKFWINGTLVATHTAQVPQHGQNQGIPGPYAAIIKSAGTTARVLTIDAIKIRVENENAVQN